LKLRLIASVCACLALLAGALPIRAQQSLGGITGTVADSTGAAVPGARVIIKNLGTNLEVSKSTSLNGSYLAPDLPIGNYGVSFTKDGFKTENHTAILVEGARTTTVNGRLEIGTVTTTVDVTGTPLLNQVDTSTGYVLDEHAIQNTPLGTGSFTQLAILSPGVSADFLNTSGANAGLGNQAIWSNGQRDTSNSFAINGLTNNNLFNGKSTSQVASSRFTANTGAVNLTGGDTQTDTSVYAAIGNSMSTPAPETLQELRVSTAMYDASEGGKSGAHISATTRTGTNAFHGQVFEHFQNNVLNAAPFFRNASTAISAHDKVPKLHYNRFGATLGGPIKKDKIFFFAAYNRIENHDALNGSRTTSVPLHLTDDRSAQALSNVALLDFGKTIAPGQIDASALKVMQFKLGGNYLIPSAQITDAATASRLGYDVYLQAASMFQHYQVSANTDFNISSKDRLSEKLIYQSSPSTSPLSSGASTYGFPQQNQANAVTAVLDNTTILSPSLTWEQKFGFVRMVSNVQTQQPANPLDLGINIFGSTSFPAIVISTADNNVLRKSFQLGSFSATANAGTFQNQYSASSSLNWVHGRHVLYAGLNWDANQLNIVNNASNVAEINFALFSDFLAGSPLASSTFNRYYAGTSNRYYRAALAGAFLQDNFRATSTLNISLGLRWDYSGPFREKFGRLVNFHPDQYKYDASSDTIASTGLVIAGNHATLGTAGVSDSTLTGRQWGFGPRIGIVWSPSSLRKVVFRAGFGMFYDRGEYFTELSPPSGSGFNGPFGVTLAPPFIQQIAPATNSSGAIVGNLAQPFAGAQLPPAVTTQSAFANLLPNAAGLLARKTTYLFGGYDPSNSLPYTENWNFDMQWQPRNSLQMSLGYVGNRSLHQVLPIPFNQPGIATAGNPIHGEIYSYGFNVVPIETARTFDGGNTDLRVPYLGISDNSVFYKAEGIATYHALQFGLRKRLSHGLQISGSYTWSHTLDEQSGLGLFFNGNDPANPRSSYGTSTYDRTHVMTVQYYYQFPKAASEHSVLGKIGNGWALSGVTILQSGFPYNEYDFSGAVAGQFYASSVLIVDPVLPLKPGVTVQQATLQGSTGYDINKPFLDSTKFAIPQLAPGQNGVPPCATVGSSQVCDTFETGYGATGRNTFRAPFQWRADVTALKQTKIGDKLTMRFQADAFNVFNHATFDAPATSSAGLYTVSNGVPTARAFLPSFGVVQRTIGSPRFLQLSMNVVF
jgi:Carboxypeptidase regulatory-like domain